MLTSNRIAGMFVPALVQTMYVSSDKKILCTFVFYKNLILMIAAIVMLSTGVLTSVLQMVEQYKGRNIIYFYIPSPDEDI